MRLVDSVENNVEKGRPLRACVVDKLGDSRTQNM